MRSFRHYQKSGFTLIELVIVIVIIGILSAVALPRLGTTANEARRAVQVATLGSLKGAWGIAYAVKKSTPNIAETIAQMDPVCQAAGTTGIQCPGVFQVIDGAALATFPVTEPITSPSLILIPVL